MQVSAISYSALCTCPSHPEATQPLPSSSANPSSNPFATGHPATPHIHQSYSQVSQQGALPGGMSPPSTPLQHRSWEDINYARGRTNDVLNGMHTAYTSFSSAHNAWNDGRYIDMFYDSYEGASGAMRSLRGALGVASHAASNAGDKALAQSLKEAAGYANSARRMLDGLLNPLSGLRKIAESISDPSRTREQKLRSIADYADGLGQTTGLAITQLDRRTGDTLLKQFGYAVFALFDAIYTARQTIAGYRQTIDTLGNDPKTSVTAAIKTVNGFVDGAQDLTEYLADSLSSADLKNQAEKMYRISAELLNIRNASNAIAMVLNKAPKDR